MIIAIVGPTGVGKTRLSLELAKKYKAIIINCDAMQVYREMNIGTAKIKESEKGDIPHFLFDIKDIQDNYTVYDYQKDARKIIDLHKGENIILVGGTGLYLKAVLYNYVFKDEEENHNNYDNLSNEEIYKLALEKDKNMNIHPNNRKRLVRFLNKSIDKKEECYQIYDAKIIGLTMDRDILYERINKRVDEMFLEGLEEEARGLYNKRGKSKALATAIGYKELFKYFDGEETLEDAKELIKKNSRHYAKRQYTWFNNQMSVKWFRVNLEDFDKTILEVESYIDNY